MLSQEEGSLNPESRDHTRMLRCDGRGPVHHNIKNTFQIQEGALNGTTNTLTSNFKPLQLQKDSFLCLKPLNLECFVMEVPGNSGISLQLSCTNPPTPNPTCSLLCALHAFLHTSFQDFIGDHKFK